MTLELLGIIFGSAVAGAGSWETVKLIMRRREDDAEEGDDGPAPARALGDCAPCKGWGWHQNPGKENTKCLTCHGTGFFPKPGYLAEKPDGGAK